MPVPLKKVYKAFSYSPSHIWVLEARGALPARRRGGGADLAYLEKLAAITSRVRGSLPEEAEALLDTVRKGGES